MWTCFIVIGLFLQDMEKNGEGIVIVFITSQLICRPQLIGKRYSFEAALGRMSFRVTGRDESQTTTAYAMQLTFVKKTKH
jgi:hypothetical protein